MHGTTASQSLLRVLGFLESRDGGGKLRGFVAHFRGKQFVQRSGVSPVEMNPAADSAQIVGQDVNDGAHISQRAITNVLNLKLV